MDRELVSQCISEIECIENDAINLFKAVPLEPRRRLHSADSDEDVVVLQWILDEDARHRSRELRRRYESWYHTSLRLIEQHLPYQIDEFKSIYEIMISYVTLNRFAATTDSVLTEVQQWHSRGYVDIYLDEFANVIDRQANIVRTLASLPDTILDRSYRCFLTGFPAPYELRENPNLVFVIMPFSDEFSDVYHLGIKESVQSLGLQCKRSDEIIHTQNVICTSICQPIRAARYVIVDITNKSPNVFYELGLTHGRLEDKEQHRKRVIIVTQNMEDLPFDLRTMSIIHYRSISDLRNRLKSVLVELIGQANIPQAQ